MRKPIDSHPGFTPQPLEERAQQIAGAFAQDLANELGIKFTDISLDDFGGFDVIIDERDVSIKDIADFLRSRGFKVHRQYGSGLTRWTKSAQRLKPPHDEVDISVEVDTGTISGAIDMGYDASELGMAAPDYYVDNEQVREDTVEGPFGSKVVIHGDVPLDGTFWVVTYATEHSELEDICFEVDLARLLTQITGGLRVEDIEGIYADEEQAKESAKDILRQREQTKGEETMEGLEDPYEVLGETFVEVLDAITDATSEAQTLEMLLPDAVADGVVEKDVEEEVIKIAKELDQLADRLDDLGGKVYRDEWGLM